MADQLYTKNGYPARLLGRTSREVSIVAFGGIVVMGQEQSFADRVVSEAVSAGINYFDVAPSYGDAQSRLGPALEPFRENVFLACKTIKRDAAGVKIELENSLKQLRTDYLDLYQLHAISDIDVDVNAVFAPGGAMETLISAKKAGVIRNIGFSTHSSVAGLEALKRFDFDTVMIAVNFVCHYRSAFETDLLSQALSRNLGIIAIKSMARTVRTDRGSDRKYPNTWYQPIDDSALAAKALSWTLAQRVSTLLPPGHYDLFKIAMDFCRDYDSVLSPASFAELKAISQACEPIFPIS